MALVESQSYRRVYAKIDGVKNRLYDDREGRKERVATKVFLRKLLAGTVPPSTSPRRRRRS